LSWEISNEVKKYLYDIMPMKKVSYIEPLTNNWEFFFKKNYMNLKSFLLENNIIELWPWYQPLPKNFKCNNYIWVDIVEENKDLWIIKWDAYSILKQMKDNTWVIVSFWMIDICVINNYKYFELLKKEIIRVSNWSAILIWQSVKDLFWKPKISMWMWGYYEFDKKWKI
jgi:hypothetical protein